MVQNTAEIIIQFLHHNVIQVVFTPIIVSYSGLRWGSAVSSTALGV